MGLGHPTIAEPLLTTLLRRGGARCRREDCNKEPGSMRGRADLIGWIGYSGIPLLMGFKAFSFESP